MENKLEKLLNSLIEKGWKPFGRETKHELSSGVVYDTIDFKGKRDIWVIDRRHHHIRELVAKESGLWQFVCENKMVELDTDSGESDSYLCYYNCDGYPKDYYFEVERDDYRFRLLESSLKDEDKLEKFLLDNIKVGNEQL